MGIKSASDDRDLYALGALLVVGLLVACGGEGGMTDPDPGPEPEPAVSALAFVTQPADATAGEAIAPAVEVEVRDGAGNRVEGATDAVTIALDVNPGGELKGTLTVNAADGVATFPDLVIERATSGYALEASVGSVSTGPSASFDVTAAAASQVGFVVEPSDAEGTVAVAPAVRVAIQDEFANTVTGATDVVTVALDASPAGATLSGTAAVSATGGVAEFGDLSLALPGEYTLEATAGGLTPATSPSFAVHVTFTQLSGGSGHTCAVTTAHAAYCWGRNEEGQLGDGTLIDRMTPVPVTGGYAFRRVTAGVFYSCGVTTADVAYCWGDNSYGKLGDGTTTVRLTPVPVAGGHSFDRIDAGGHHTCAVTTGDAPYCWGGNVAGQLGDGTNTDRATPAPVLLFGGLSLAQISAGGGHTCGVSTSGVTRCWGSNLSGQLGDGTTTERTIPVAVAGGHDFDHVAAGHHHTCAVTVAGVGYCWGGNADGQLGDGTTMDWTTPRPVAGGHLFEQMVAGWSHNCGVTTDDLSYCWGRNSGGAIGDGTTTDRLTPAPVAGGHSFDRIYASVGNTCAITIDDAAYCWGPNGAGQLGDGTTANSTIPVKVVQ